MPGLPASSGCSVIKVWYFRMHLNVVLGSVAETMYLSSETMYLSNLHKLLWVMVASLQPPNDKRADHNIDFCTVNWIPLLFFIFMMSFIALFVFI